MDRSKIIFDYIFKDNKYSLDYHSCDFESKHPYESRIIKEKIFIKFSKFNKFLDNFEDFHKWIYSEHQYHQ